MTTMPAFVVRRKEPLHIRPAAATPRETKHLSVLDNQVFIRKHVPCVFFYRSGEHHASNPVEVIRRALGEALVPYYPLAGRLREEDGGTLVVDCTGEGVLFVEADADVRLAELEAAGLRPPYPCMDQLLFHVQLGICDSPLLLTQVTRLLCGGFVLAFHLNHTICDGTGIAQFFSAVAELARGLPSPTISPAWSRDLLLLGQHSASPAAALPKQLRATPSDTVVTRIFTFSPLEIADMKTHLLLPRHLTDIATTFEVLTAGLWRARTAALQLPPDEEVSMLFTVNIRSVRELGLPAGYYGNAIVIAVARTTARDLLARSLGETVELVKAAKAAVRSDPLTLLPWENLATSNAAFLVSDTRRVGFQRMDFGWGEPVCGGQADTQHVVSFLLDVKSGGGENAIAVPVLLPPAAMHRFASEVETMLQKRIPVPLNQASPAPQARL